MDILNELRALIQKLNEEQIEYALCGGLAMAVYALPRATLDIDILTLPALLERVRRVANELGFTVNAAPMVFQDGKIVIHRVSKIDPDTGETLSLGILLVTPDIQTVWSGRLFEQWTDGSICIVSPEGMILLKSIRNSGQDTDDIAYLRRILDED